MLSTRALATCHVNPTLTLVRGLETKREFRRPTPGLNRNPRNRRSKLFPLWMQPIANLYLMQKMQNRDV